MYNDDCREAMDEGETDYNDEYAGIWNLNKETQKRVAQSVERHKVVFNWKELAHITVEYQWL